MQSLCSKLFSFVNKYVLYSSASVNLRKLESLVDKARTETLQVIYWWRYLQSNKGWPAANFDSVLNQYKSYSVSYDWGGFVLLHERGTCYCVHRGLLYVCTLFSRCVIPCSWYEGIFEKLLRRRNTNTNTLIIIIELQHFYQYNLKIFGLVAYLFFSCQNPTLKRTLY